MRQIIQTNLLFPLDQVNVPIDFFQDSKKIAIRAVLKDLTYILFGFDSSKILDYTRMVHATKNEAFNDSLMKFTFFIHIFFADNFQCILLFIILDFEYLPERTIRYFTYWLVFRLFEEVIQILNFVRFDVFMLWH